MNCLCLLTCCLSATEVRRAVYALRNLGSVGEMGMEARLFDTIDGVGVMGVSLRCYWFGNWGFVMMRVVVVGRMCIAGVRG